MIWLTEIEAIDPKTKELTSWCGPRIEADTYEEAQRFCNANGMGYCRVIGSLVREVIKEEEEDICLN